MMGTPTHEAFTHNTNNSHNHNSHSNLTSIRGIGAARKQWLNSLGIYTIADLAHASADEIESQFKNNGRSLSRNELDEWIAQAQLQQATLSLQPVTSLYQENETHDNETVNIHDTKLSLETTSQIASDVELIASENTPEKTPEKNSDTSATEWNSIASFKVEYQTRFVQDKLEQQIVIHHLETGVVECQPSFETCFIQEWMLAQIGTTELQSKIEPSDKPDITPIITQLRVIQAQHLESGMIADKTCPLFSDAIQADEPFDLEVLAQFTGFPDTTMREQVTYQVQCIAHDLSTGLTANLGEVRAKGFISNNTIHSALLPNLVLSPGIYRLKVLVTLQDALATSSYFKVPMLQVV